MAHKLGFDPMFCVELLLERENHQHFIYKFADEPNARLSPGPKLRADVVHDRNTSSLQLPRQPEVEIGKVNQHGDLGPAAVHRSHHLAKQSINARQMSHHLRKANNRDLMSIDNQIASSLSHRLAAHSEELSTARLATLAQLLAKSFDQASAIQ